MTGEGDGRRRQEAAASRRPRGSNEMIRELSPSPTKVTGGRSASHYEDDDEVVVDVPQREPLPLREAGGVGDQKDFVAPWWVDLLFWICGISVFARTEAFFTQTSLFVSPPSPPASPANHPFHEIKLDQSDYFIYFWSAARQLWRTTRFGAAIDPFLGCAWWPPTCQPRTRAFARADTCVRPGVRSAGPCDQSPISAKSSAWRPARELMNEGHYVSNPLPANAAAATILRSNLMAHQRTKPLHARTHTCTFMHMHPPTARGFRADCFSDNNKAEKRKVAQPTTTPRPPPLSLGCL